MGTDFPFDYLNCKPDDANGENEHLNDAKTFCAAQNAGGKFDCRLVEVDPTDTERSTFVQRLSEPSCDSTSGALTTDAEDATIAIDTPGSWILVEHSKGYFKTAIAGAVKFRGGNCGGDDCPLSLTYLGIETPSDVTFVHSDGTKTLIKKPFVRVPEVITAMTSKKTTTGIAGYEFAFPKDSLRILASGTVDGRRALIAAANEQATPTGRLLKNGEFLFDATATADDFKVTLHVVGRVRTWPPFLRLDRATFERKRRREILDLRVRTFSWASSKVALQVVGPRFVAPLRTRRGGGRVEIPVGLSDLAVRACTNGVCVQQPIPRPGTTPGGQRANQIAD